MLETVAAILALIMSGKAVDPDAGGQRRFLMLNDQAIEFVNGAPVLGYWRTEHKWDARQKRASDLVDGVEFVMSKQFWRMVEENSERNSASSEVRVDAGGRLFYQNRPVDIGLGVGRLEYVLHWREWIVAVGTASDRAKASIKGPIWYLFWFEQTTLKGAYLQISTTGPLPLRIYSK